MVGTLMQIEQLSRDQAGCHAKELATRSGLDPSTVSRAVAALVAEGLIERRADPTDKRASILVLTAAGSDALADARAFYLGLLSRALADWHPDEVAAFTAALARLTAGLTDTLACPPHPTPHPDPLEAAR